ncbi:hypothetical protein [Halobaculum sp. MBLA0143]|uniref:hypothetical protein n=1 Tax=Halobaculum sp. MBLA0143 TaxID=3079933 RepID=UPI0035265A61
MTGLKNEASIVLGKTLDYMPFLLLAAVGIALFTDQTDKAATFWVLFAPAVLAFLFAVVVYVKREFVQE